MMDSPSRRQLRAKRFADTIISLLRDFLPSDRDTLERIYDLLAEEGYELNAEIISVPLELDALDKLQIERKMLETHPLFIAAGANMTDDLKLKGS
jgi:hypothetical protein